MAGWRIDEVAKCGFGLSVMGWRRTEGEGKFGGGYAYSGLGGCLAYALYHLGDVGVGIGKMDEHDVGDGGEVVGLEGTEQLGIGHVGTEGSLVTLTGDGS